MERITNIKNDHNKGSGFFHTDDIAEANLLRRAIMNEIKTYSIEFVRYDVNTTVISDEELAGKLGALVINQRDNLPKELIETWLDVDFTAVELVNFTSDDLAEQTGLTFNGRSLLVSLIDEQRLRFQIKVRQGKNKDHQKFRPVAEFPFKPVVNGKFVIPRKSKIEITGYFTARITILDNKSQHQDSEIAQLLANMNINYSHFKGQNKNEVEFEITNQGLFHEQLWMYHYDPNFPEIKGDLSVKVVLKQGDDNRYSWKKVNNKEQSAINNKVNKTPYVSEIIFHSNTTNMDNEFITGRISELKLKSDIGAGTYRFKDVEIASLLQSHNLFDFHLPIGRIQENQELSYDIVVSQGDAPIEIAWTEPTNYKFTQYNGYYFEFVNVGMLTTEQIFTRGYEAIIEAACAESDTLFTRQMIPVDMVLPENCVKT